MKKVLFIGDIFGRPGRDIVIHSVKGLIERHNLDFVIADAENSAGGAGVTQGICEELHNAGVDAITLGDHVWDQRGFSEVIDKIPYVCRPTNLPCEAPGKGYLVIEKGGFRLGVYTMLGRTFMKIRANCPFEATKKLLPHLSEQTDAILGEIHAEATAEKIAYGWFVDGKVAAVLGTHTHVPTADLRLLHHNTAYVTDVGMSGPYDSVIGSEKDPIIEGFFDGMPRRFSVAKDNVQLHGCIISIDEATGLACGFEKVVHFKPNTDGKKVLVD